MEILTINMLVAISIALLIIAILIYKNSKLKSDNKEIHKILALKDQTISNYEASRVAVQDVLQNISLIDKVIPLIKKGNSREEIAKRLNIDIKQVETIVKLDRLKRVK